MANRRCRRCQLARGNFELLPHFLVLLWGGGWAGAEAAVVKVSNRISLSQRQKKKMLGDAFLGKKRTGFKYDFFSFLFFGKKICGKCYAPLFFVTETSFPSPHASE